MRKRVIFHIDINHCYAQIEEMLHPALRNVPMAVGGHEEKRQGIILAKNDLAKKAGILTGESLRDARRKLPDLLIIPPHYEEYIYYTSKVKDIYRRYSDHVESFGLDEAWIDYTDSVSMFGKPETAALQIQQQVYEETGLTVSAGVSWNKAFAKLGSDLKKPMGLTIITEENYRDLVWPLPVEDLLYVGPATSRKLHARCIETIGDLACYPLPFLKKYLGKAGEVIWNFANGNDPSPVEEQNWRAPVKSVGNSMTMIHDVDNLEDLRPVYIVIAECLASRLKEEGMEGDLISISLRSSSLDWFGRQMHIDRCTDVSDVILQAVMTLAAETYDFSYAPLRAVGASVSDLHEACGGRQLSLFTDEEKYEKARRADIAVDDIRSRYGFYSIRRASTLIDRPLCDFNPKGDHTVHPTGYFQGRKMS